MRWEILRAQCSPVCPAALATRLTSSLAPQYEGEPDEGGAHAVLSLFHRALAMADDAEYMSPDAASATAASSPAIATAAVRTR